MALERGAMVSASTGAMNSVLAKCVILISGEVVMTTGFRKQLLVLVDELHSMKGLLEKLAESEERDALVKGWMSQVREMTYDLDDSIDLFMHSASGPDGGAKPSSFVKKAFRKLSALRGRHQIASQIQELKMRVQEASERRSRYQLDTTGSSLHNVPIDPRLPASPVNVDTPVGIDAPRDDLIKLLGDDRPQQLLVAAVLGFGGLGKTTLAMTVYERLQMQFHSQAVVSVSRRPDMNRLLRDILFQVRGAQDYAVMETSDLAQLVNALREFLRRKRYIIMINDLWSTEEWNMIRYALPENDLGSRILVTTRVMDVAFSCCNHERGYVYKLKPLSVSDSRELFLRRIFGSESKGCCPEDLYGISEEILKICEGLPLAITTVCGLLASRSINILVWMRIKDSIRSNIEKNDSYAGMIISILNVCYAHLPIYLKPCLLYLSMFPEDNVIDRKRLVRRWMAEGFIRAEHGKSLEEVGDYYFSELVNSGLIQPLGIQYDDQLYACQVHDVILDFILQRSLEDNFVVRSNDGFASRLQDKVRRLFLDCRDGWNTFTPSEITTFHVRSLTVIGSNRQMPSLASFRALRVLDLENSGQLERNYFQGIGRLYLLKYLRLQTPSVIQLPEEMGKLVNLETLDLAGAPKSKLPNSIIELKKLIYFLANNVNIPNRFGSMLSLQEVSCVQIDSSNFKSTLHELEKLTVLTVLGLNSCIGDEDTDMKDTLVSFLSKVIMSKNIKSLYIESADCYSLDFLLNIHSNPCYHLREFHTKSNYFFQTVPEWICTVFNLTTLRINIEILGEEVLHILGGLQSLEALILMVNSTAPEQGLIIRSNEFRCLKQFDFTCWNSLGVLKFETGAMKNLQKLRAVFSRHGGGVANDFLFSIEHLTSLKHVVIEVKCEDVKANEVKTVVDAVNGAVRNHPNNPIRLVLKAHAGEKAAAVEREIAVHGEEGKNQNEEHEVVIEAESTSATN